MSEAVAAGEEIATALDGWCERLRALSDAAFDAVVDAPDQLTVQNLIAAGVAVLASEQLPAVSETLPTRRMLARDLWITADLVRRSLRSC